MHRLPYNAYMCVRFLEASLLDWAIHDFRVCLLVTQRAGPLLCLQQCATYATPFWRLEIWHAIQHAWGAQPITVEGPVKCIPC